jgi:hypothetical protein
MPRPGKLLVGVTDSVGIFERVVLDHIEAFLPLKNVHWTCAEPTSSSSSSEPPPPPPPTPPPSSAALANVAAIAAAAAANVLASRAFIFSDVTMSFCGAGGWDMDTRGDSGGGSGGGSANSLEWHNIPTLEIYVVTCESVNEYRRRFKDDLAEWLERTRAQRPHAQTAVLFVPTARKSSAIRAVETTLNKIPGLQPSSQLQNQPLKHVLRFDMPSRGSTQSEKHKKKCRDLLSSFANLALRATTTRCFDIDRDMRRQASLSPSSWSIYSHFIVRERMAQLCSRLHLYANAIEIYDELSATLRADAHGLSSRGTPSSTSFFSSSSSSSTSSSSSSSSEGLGVEILMLRVRKLENSRALLSATRAKIAGESISARDFLSYIFACKLSIAEKSGQKTMIPTMAKHFISSLVPVPTTPAMGQHAMFTAADATTTAGTVDTAGDTADTTAAATAAAKDRAQNHAWAYSVCDIICRKFEHDVETSAAVAAASLSSGAPSSVAEETKFAGLLEFGWKHLLQLGRILFGQCNYWNENGQLLFQPPSNVIAELRRRREEDHIAESNASSAGDFLKSTNAELASCLASPVAFRLFLLRVGERLLGHFKAAKCFRKMLAFNLQHAQLLMRHGSFQEACILFQQASATLRMHGTWNTLEMCTVLGEAACRLALGGQRVYAQLLVNALVLCEKKGQRQEQAHHRATALASNILAEIVTLGAGGGSRENATSNERVAEGRFEVMAGELIRTSLECLAVSSNADDNSVMRAGVAVRLRMHVTTAFPGTFVVDSIRLYFHSIKRGALQDNTSNSQLPLVCTMDVHELTLTPRRNKPINVCFEFPRHGCFVLDKIAFLSGRLELCVLASSVGGSASFAAGESGAEVGSANFVFDVAKQVPQLSLTFIGHHVLVPAAPSEQYCLLRLRPSNGAGFNGGQADVSLCCSETTPDGFDIQRALSDSSCRVFKRHRTPTSTPTTAAARGGACATGDLAEDQDEEQQGDVDKDRDEAAAISEIPTETLMRTAAEEPSPNRSGILAVPLPPCHADQELVIVIGVRLGGPNLVRAPIDIVCRANLYQATEALQRNPGLAVSLPGDKDKCFSAVHVSAVCVYKLVAGLSVQTGVHTNTSEHMGGCLFVSSRIRPILAKTHARILSAVLDPIEDYHCKTSSSVIQVLEDGGANCVASSTNNFWLFWRYDCRENKKKEGKAKALESHLKTNLTVEYTLLTDAASALEKKFAVTLTQIVPIKHLLAPLQEHQGATLQKKKCLDVTVPVYGIVGCKASFDVFLPKVSLPSRLVVECRAEPSDWMMIGKSTRNVQPGTTQYCFELLPLQEGHLNVPTFCIRVASKGSPPLAISKSISMSISPSGVFRTSALPEEKL